MRRTMQRLAVRARHTSAPLPSSPQPPHMNRLHACAHSHTDCCTGAGGIMRRDLRRLTVRARRTAVRAHRTAPPLPSCEGAAYDMRANQKTPWHTHLSALGWTDCCTSAGGIMRRVVRRKKCVRAAQDCPWPAARCRKPVQPLLRAKETFVPRKRNLVPEHLELCCHTCWV